MTTWRLLLHDAQAELDLAGRPSPDVDARRIIEAASGADGPLTWIAEQDAPLPAARHARDMVARRARGEPLQYVLGSWSFLDLDLFVDRRVLIPRPETECTAQVALDEAARLGARRGRRDPWRGSLASFLVADLGTGSGAIALAVATTFPDAEVWATDVSADALAVARANLAGSGGAAAQIRVAEGDWFDALPATLRGQFKLIVSNPPYVAASEVAELPAEVAAHEPRAALVSGPTGFEAIARIVAGAPDYLRPGAGTLVVELAPHQASAALDAARAAGFADARVECDLAGRERVLVARGG
ncbi:MAG TPA: peptide chain release factor N(5)-glutamine methyltransferase [Acidimicrobiia bacterium]